MSNKARILFVDDEQRVLNSMRGMFRRDYELFLTTDGKEAITIAQNNPIDVIVADQRMPGMTGVEVLGKMKTLSPRTVRILLTGYADPAAVEGSINIGEVFRFLSKPCPPQLLRDTLGLAIAAARTKARTQALKPPTAQPRPASQTPQPAARPLPAVNPSPRPPQTSAAPSAPGQAPVPDRKQAPPEVQLQDNENTEPALPILDETGAPRLATDESASRWMSVTNVVMAEDRNSESQENVALSETNEQIAEVPIVVFTVDSEFAATAIRAIGADRSATLATTLVKVAHAIEAQHAGVLVTDFTSNSALLQRMIGVLKVHVPQLATIVVSSQRDSTDMINLINYGQVFRYLVKPVEPGQLRSDINAAAIHYLHLVNNPESAKRHQVIESADHSDTSMTLNRFVSMIREHQHRRSNPSDTQP
ncbi:MAG: response regulator [Gammaproteobacteria bacterium]|nr:response regulator [Gammaproteobacteria bacterium]